MGKVREEKRREEKRREEKRREEKKKEYQKEKVSEPPKKEDPVARKGRKVAKHCVFPMICGSGGSKSRLGKAAGAEPGQMRDAKLHAVVARSTFPSQSAQNTSASEHFWKLRCRNSARRGDVKHLSVHQCICSAIPDSQQPTSPIGFLFLKLPPPPCAALLVMNKI